jgi:hypothetical protein
MGERGGHCSIEKQCCLETSLLPLHPQAQLLIRIIVGTIARHHCKTTSASTNHYGLPN